VGLFWTAAEISIFTFLQEREDWQRKKSDPDFQQSKGGFLNQPHYGIGQAICS
jgi:hypothetical protein